MNATIVGAGVAGLTLGYLLATKGIEVQILEKEQKIGGLARSFHYDNWSIDIGPHRFHTDDIEVENFIKSIMGDDLITIPRTSKVFFCGKHFNWPLELKSIIKLPPSLLLSSFWDLMVRPKIQDDSFESYVNNKYGKTLTNSFFREYTEKFLKLNLKECHRHWAETGINRATIDKNVRSSSITDLLFGLLRNKKVNTKFLYPKNGTIDIYSKRLAEEICNKGGTVETGINFEKSVIKNNEVKCLIDHNGREYEIENLFWSGASYDLERLLGGDKVGLDFCSTLICNILVEGYPIIPAQWEYFGSREVIFSRVSTNISFNPCLAKEGYFGICAEVVCYENDYIWKEGEKLLNTIIQNLINTNIVRNFNSVMDVHFEKIRNTYPIYRLDYVQKLEKYESKIAQFKNVLAFGRSGAFWYNNMDHSIRASIDLANLIDPGNHNHNIAGLPVKGIFRGDF